MKKEIWKKITNRVCQTNVKPHGRESEAWRRSPAWAWFDKEIQVLRLDRSLRANGSLETLEGPKGVSPASGPGIKVSNQDGCFLSRCLVEGWGNTAVLYRLCWRSLGARARRTCSRRGNRRWRGSEEGGSLVAHSPAVEANSQDSLGARFPRRGRRTDGRQGFHGDTATRNIWGEILWKRSERRARGSDVIHALMRCLYMQLIWIQFAPCVQSVHAIDVLVFFCLCSRI